MYNSIITNLINTKIENTMTKDAQLLAVLGLNSFADLLAYMDDCKIAITKSIAESFELDKLTSHNDKVYADINSHRESWKSSWLDYESEYADNWGEQ